LKSRSKGKPTDEERQILQDLSKSIKEKEVELNDLEQQRTNLLVKLPNINDPETPIGATEDFNKVVATVGEKPVFDFEPVPYYDLPSVKPFIKLEEGTRTSGSRFYYLTGKIAMLQRAVFRAASQIIADEGFELVIPPLLVRERAMYGTGHFPADRFEIYHVNPEEDDLYLVGTAEVPLVSLHDGETLNATDLPKMYMAETTCFRREAGSYGKDQAGILRVHQFQKVEMVAFTTPDKSQELHARIRAVEEKIISHFGLHYQIVDICTGDLGYPATRKWDMEAWFPSQNKFRELTSTSNTSDYQTRRLNIGYRDESGERKLLHSVNGTGVTDRLWLAILEQYQQADGSVKLPPALHSYLPWTTLEA
jgi:seryl-tRNA synthetase